MERPVRTTRAHVAPRQPVPKPYANRQEASANGAEILGIPLQGARIELLDWPGTAARARVPDVRAEGESIVANPLKFLGRIGKEIGKGAFKGGKFAWHNRELIAMAVPYGAQANKAVAGILGAIRHVDGLIEGGRDPGTGANRRAEAIRWLRELGPDWVKNSDLAAMSDEILAALIDREIMKRKYPEMFPE